MHRNDEALAQVLDTNQPQLLQFHLGSNGRWLFCNKHLENRLVQQ